MPSRTPTSISPVPGWRVSMRSPAVVDDLRKPLLSPVTLTGPFASTLIGRRDPAARRRRFASDHCQVGAGTHERPLLVESGEQQQIVDQPAHPCRSDSIREIDLQNSGSCLAPRRRSAA